MDSGHEDRRKSGMFTILLIEVLLFEVLLNRLNPNHLYQYIIVRV